jgi:DNA-directed RNA polymerase subunit RPC12/RpoP
MSLVTYQCPSCNADIAVENHLSGEAVSCPRCGRPFIAEPPRSQPKEVSGSEQARYVVRDAADVEETLRQAHPVMFRRHPGRYLLTLALAVAGAWGCLSWWSVGDQGSRFGWLSLAALILGGGSLLVWRIRTLASTLTVTNKRTRFSRGLISRHTTEVQHDDVRNLQIHQSIWGRLTNVGDLEISSSGQDDIEIQARGLSNPAGIAELIRQRQ